MNGEHAPSTMSGILRRWWIVVGAALLGAIIGGYPEPEQVEQTATSYRATNTSLASDAAESSDISPDQVTLLATVGEVPRRVGDELGLGNNPSAVASQVRVEYDFATGALTVSTEQDTAEQAEVLADTYAETINSYIVERQTELYQNRLSASRARVDALEEELNAASVAAAADLNDAVLQAERDAISLEYGLAFEQNRQLERQDATPLTFTTLEMAQAVPNVDSGLATPRSRTVRAIMGFVVGGALGLALAYILSVSDKKVRSREQIEEITDMRARVAIPQVRRTEGGIVVAEGRHDPLSDAYRTVRNLVGFVQSRLEPVDRARITVVVSPGPGDGKTSLSANLASAFLETGQRTIAVNTDFRRPRLSNAITGSPAAPVPFDYGELRNVDTPALLAATKQDNFRILDLSSVEGSPGDLVRATIPHLERLAEVSDEIVIDTSPIGATAEVLDLIPHADIIVVTARVGHTKTQAIERMATILRDLATCPLILVVGGTKRDRNAYYEYTSRSALPSGHSIWTSVSRLWRDDRPPTDDETDSVDDEAAGDRPEGASVDAGETRESSQLQSSE